MPTAREICQRNAEAAKARKEQARAQFPACVEIVDWMKSAGFDGFRIVKMQEGEKSWSR